MRKFKEFKSLSVGKEVMEREYMSFTETFILARLYMTLREADYSSEVMKEAYLANGKDADEVEEAVVTLREQAFIQYQKRKFILTEDGKEQLLKMATFEGLVENDKQLP